MGKNYVLDTNIILDDPSNIIKLYDNGENNILIPEVVIDELDAKKSGFDDINYNARQFARLLEESEIISNERIDELIFIDTRIESLNINITIVSKDNYKCEASNVATNILNDRKILEVAEFIKNIGNKEVIFLSLDIMCRTRALSLGIKTETLKGKDQTIDLEFHKTLKVENVNGSFNGKDILEINPDHKPMNFSYTLEDENTGQQKLAQVQNGHIYLVQEKELEKQSVRPMNKEQKFFVNALVEGFANIVAIDAKAGSGKTLISLATAMRLVKKKEYSKIIYIRNSIESLDKGEDVGYLPGLEEKFAIYNHPLMDNLKYIARNEIKKRNTNTSNANKDKEDDTAINTKVDEYMKKYGIETMWVGEMRGRTLSEAIVIVDEAQNMSSKTLQLVLSRVDKTCKVIVIGSNKQIDNMYTNKYVNGLSVLLNSMSEPHEEVKLWAGELNKVLRGPITEFAEKIFSR
jgi:PhoH-like ATPase